MCFSVKWISGIREFHDGELAERKDDSRNTKRRSDEGNRGQQSHCHPNSLHGAKAHSHSQNITKNKILLLEKWSPNFLTNLPANSCFGKTDCLEHMYFSTLSDLPPLGPVGEHYRSEISLIDFCPVLKQHHFWQWEIFRRLEVHGMSNKYLMLLRFCSSQTFFFF